MGIFEILESEKENTTIILHKEGIFYRAYEISAYLFSLYIKKYKLTKKFYKNAKHEVVYLGFPKNSFIDIEIICKKQNLSVKKKDNQILISGFKNFPENDFLIWKNSIALWQNAETLSKFEYPDIVEKIKSFPIINKTPVECQQFIIELQSELQTI